MKIDEEKGEIFNNILDAEELVAIPVKDFKNTESKISTGYLERELFKKIIEEDIINVDECVFSMEPFPHNPREKVLNNSLRKHELWKVLRWNGVLIFKIRDSQNGISCCEKNDSKRTITCQDEKDVKIAIQQILRIIERERYENI